MTTGGLHREVPGWALPLLIVVLVIVLAFIGWKVFGGGHADVGPAKEVRPGMYDFKQEFMKGNLGRRQRTGGAGGG